MNQSSPQDQLLAPPDAADDSRTNRSIQFLEAPLGYRGARSLERGDRAFGIVETNMCRPRARHPQLGLYTARAQWSGCSRP